MIRRAWKLLVEATRRYFVAGLLALAPIGITVWAIGFIVTRLDNLLLPRVLDLFSPGLATRVDLPPLVGAIFTFVVILVAGVIVRHLFGQELIRISERLLARVPVARSLYGGVKQLFEALFSASSSVSRFNRVVLVEYPKEHLYALAFTTSSTRGPVEEALPHDRLINCFVPTTPNPTSGFYLVVPEEEVYPVDISVEAAFKLVMSAGLVAPPESPEAIPARPPDATT